MIDDREGALEGGVLDGDNGGSHASTTMRPSQKIAHPAKRTGHLVMLPPRGDDLRFESRSGACS